MLPCCMQGRIEVENKVEWQDKCVPDIHVIFKINTNINAINLQLPCLLRRMAFALDTLKRRIKNEHTQSLTAPGRQDSAS